MSTMARGPFGCHGSHLALFAPPGKPYFALSASIPTPYREATSSASTCGSKANAKSVFDQITSGSLPVPNESVPNIPGIGDDARLLSFDNAYGRVAAVYWRAGQDLGIVSVAGPADDTRINRAVAEELAKKAVDGS